MGRAGSSSLLHLIAIGAIAGLGVVALRGGELPRTPIDLPLLGLLAALALATASALNVGMSLRAMAAIAAFAAMLPVALLAVRHRPVWVGLVTSVPGAAPRDPDPGDAWSRDASSGSSSGRPGSPRCAWRAEGTPFGSVAVPPFVLIPAWALAGLIEPPGLRRVVRTGLVAVGIPLVILSGSRSAWLAIAAGAAIGIAALGLATTPAARAGLAGCRPAGSSSGLGCSSSAASGLPSCFRG